MADQLRRAAVRFGVSCATLAALSLAACAPVVASQAAAPAKNLKAFADEAELTALLAKWGEEQKKRQGEARRDRLFSQATPAASPAPAAASEATADSITNVQHAGVDEGGIVKLHGEHLVVLRRGRLFTVRIGGDQLRPVAAVDAFGPAIEPRGAWYDEMLLYGNTVVVIGYSYQRGGTEIGLFTIGADGSLAYKSTHHLRSNDYYSSRNYASRLIGSKLIFYTPLVMNIAAPKFPAQRDWRPGATDADWQRIAPATRIYRTDDDLDPRGGIALHTVSVCDLAKPQFSCESTAVLGRPGRVFYVSPDSVFVWTTDWLRARNAAPAAAVFRIPLDGSAPSGLKTAGSPIDQMSFLQGNDDHLNVLLRADGAGGDGMWRAEAKPGDLALLRVPLTRFGDGTERAEPALYTPLPAAGTGWSMQNRFVGDYLIYGTGVGWRQPGNAPIEAVARAVRYARDREAYAVPLPHGVDRIEAMGSNAVIVGTDGRDLHFTSVRLAGLPVPMDRYTQPNAAQGETRTHGFFYRPDTAAGTDSGTIGLPIIGGGQSAASQLKRTAAQVLYVRNDSLNLRPLGALDARASNVQDNCRASCVDWYGNARPLFIGQRVFALLGYEIVEGKLSTERIAERRRVSFAPGGVGVSQ